MFGFPRAYLLLLILVFFIILITTTPRIQHAQSCAPPPAGLVSWWPGDGNANDIQGGNNGTLQNGATFAPGMVGQAFQFQNGGHIDVNPNSSLDLTRFTVEAWIKPNGTGTEGFIVDKSVVGAINYFLSRTGDGRVYVDFYDGVHRSATSTSTCTPDTWCHVAGTYDGATLKIYFNGVLEGTLNYIGTPPAQGQSLIIGQRNGGTFPFQGLIDEVGIYNRALTDLEIQSIYNAGGAGKCKFRPLAYVANSGSNTVSVIDAGTNTVVKTIPVSVSPAGVTVGTVGNRVYVIHGSGNLTVIDRATDTVVTTLPVGNSPSSVALNPDGTRAYVANAFSNTVSVIDTAANRVVATIPVGSSPSGVIVTPDGKRAYVTNQKSDSVSVIDTAKNVVTTGVGLFTGANPSSIAITPDGARVLVGTTFLLGPVHHVTVEVISTASNTVVASNEIIGGPFSGANTKLALNPDGTRLYVYPNPFFDFVNVYNVTDNNFRFVASVNQGGQVSALAVSSDGSRCYATLNGFGSLSNSVQVIDTATNKLVSTISVGSNPNGIAISPGVLDLVNLSSLTLNPAALNAGETSTATVTLDIPAPAGGAIVSLASSDHNVATVPDSITIAQGSTSGSFTVTTNHISTDSAVDVSASYGGKTKAASLSVIGPHADLQVSSLSAPAQASTDSAFDLPWTDTNGGQARANGLWTDKVYLSTDNQPGSDTLLAQFPFDGSLDGGQSTPLRIQQVSIPRAAVPTDGQYFLIVSTDADNNVDEGSNEGNNWRAVPITLTRPAFPDLIVDSIQAPSTAFFDQTVTVRWTVKNAGNGSTNASEWRDRLSLSPNQAGGDESVQLAVSNISYLNAGESYVASADVHIPRGLFGTYFFIVRADSGNAVTEDNENNNTLSQAISLQIPPLPDLQVSLVQAPESGFAGQPMQINWRVENRGTGNTPSAEGVWTDAIYLSKDQTFDPSDRLIGTQAHQGGLMKDDGYTVSNFSVNIPVDIAGDWYVFVVADYQNKVYEFVNENNNSNLDARHAIHIQATPPDLIVSTIETQGTAAAGSQVTVNWTVRNQGAFDAVPGWFDTVYLSTDATLDPATDTPLATVFRPSSLGPGLEYSASATVGLPVCTSGTYFLFVFTDSRNQIFEFDPSFDAEHNNFSQAHTVQVTLALPDLQVTAVSNPPTGNAGQTVPVSWTVTNSGSVTTAEGSWDDRVYLSLTPTLDTHAALMAGSFTHSGQLGVNGSYTSTQNVTIPSGAQGVYHVFVLTDARGQVEECAGEGNNARAGQDAINVINNQPPPPDLTVTNVSAPGSAFTGQAVTVQWTVNNAGSAIASNSAWNDVVYLSSNPTLGSGDARVETKLVKGPLATSVSYSAQAQAVIPAVTAGTYFLIVKTDGDDFISEGQHEDNNVGSAAITVGAPSVDLQVASVGAPAQAFSGQSMAVSWSVRNAGAMQTFAQQWTDYVFLSRDQILDPTDRVISFQAHTSPLESGGEYTANVNATVPPGLSGPYYVFVRTDYHDRVAETAEDNNVGGPAAVSLRLPPPVDLTVLSVEPPANASPGEQATFRWVVRNAGTNTAGGSWTDAVYLSTDITWDIDDALVGRVGQGGPFAPGETYTGELTAALPAVNPGQYHVIVRTDVRNNLRESDETNNMTASAGTTTVDVPELQLGVPFNTTLQAEQERYHKVNAPAGETLLYTLHAEQQDGSTELYARSGAMPSRSAFDYLFGHPGEADQEIVIPNTLAGFYYDLIRGESVSGTTPATIKAETIPFSIRSVSPNRVGDNGQVTITLHGARFQDGAAVQLIGNGATLTATKVTVLDSTRIKARFSFTDAPHGTYDVMVTNPSSAMATKPQSVIIEVASPLAVTVAAGGITAIRHRQPLFVQCALKNMSNVDIPYASVGMVVSREVGLEILGPDKRLPSSSDLPTDQWVRWGTSTAGSTEAAFIVRDLEAGNSLPFAVRTDRLADGMFSVTINAQAATRSEAESDMSKLSEDLRQALINEPNIHLSPEAQASLSDPIQWSGLISNTLISIGLIDTPLGNATISDKLHLKAPESRPTCHTLHRACQLIELLNFACDHSHAEELGICFEFENLHTGCEAAEQVCPQIECNNAQINWALHADENGGVTTGSCIDVGRAADPNDKIGLPGFGPQAFVGIQKPLFYTVNFENLPTATATAQRVRVSDQLDPNLDARTFRLKEIGFGSYRVTVPENRAFYQTRVHLGADLGNLLADISAGVDIATGQVTWTLTAIDPQTGEQPTSAALGLLPPNDETGRGQGYVTYTVQPKATAQTGTQVANSATITFDTNEPLTTNTVTNTLDADPPASTVAALPASSDQTFTLSWSGEDPADGSGLQSFDIWVSENAGPYQPFVSGTTDTNAQFTGNSGSTYRFYSIARDNAGNVEAAPSVPDAVTAVTPMPNPVPTLTALNPNSAAAGSTQFTLTAAGTNFVNGSVLNWNGSPRVTTFVTPSQVTAAIPASDIASDGTATITVTNPAPGGGSSNPLTFNITPAATPTPTPTATPTPTPTPASKCAGDLNLDGVVDTADLEIVRSAFGSRCGTTEYRAAADVNHDCVVDVTDLAIVSRDLGCTWTPPRFSIGGRVVDGAGTGIGNVTLTLSGSQSVSTQTDGGGAYSFPNLSAGNYILTPTLTGFTFNPANLSFANLAGDQTANFNGAPNTFSLAGKVTFGNVGFGGVTITLGGSQTRTVTTDSGGNFLISNLPQPGNYTIIPSRTNFTFTPQNRTLNNPSGDQAANFTAAVTPGVPVLISEEDSTRALALDSVMWLPGPFQLNYSALWGVDTRTRVTLFATNFDLLPGDTVSLVSADAEDASHHIYPLNVEYVGKVNGFDWLRCVVIRLNDDMSDVGDVLVRINVRGIPSNRVRLGVGHVGGGPPDDPWAVPTPGRQP